MIKPGVEYTREEVAQFRDDPELADVLLRGYVFSLTLGGNFMLIPWNQAAGGGFTGKGTAEGNWDADASQGTSFGRPQTIEFDPRDHLPPIVKRTPQERLRSLMDKVGDDLRLYLSGQKGEIVTGEETVRVARQALEEANREFERTESKRYTRTTGNPYA